MILKSGKRFLEKIMLTEKGAVIPGQAMSASHRGIVELPLVPEDVAFGVLCFRAEEFRGL